MAGTAAMIGPMIGTNSSRPAISASTSVNCPNSLKPMTVRIVRPMTVARKIDAPSSSWPRTQRPPTRPSRASSVLRVGPPPRRQRAGDGPGEPLTILEHVEEPDRDDDEPEDERRGAEHRGDRRSEQRRRRISANACPLAATCTSTACSQLVGQREAGVPLDERALDVADGCAELGKVRDELASSGGRSAAARTRSRPRPPATTADVGDEHAGPAGRALARKERDDRVEHERERQRR